VIPLALYIHLPWCVRKCPYCDFNSHGVEEGPDESAYVEALLSDLQLELPLVDGRKLGSIFIGGGTPSLFSGEAIAQLLDGVRGAIDCVPDLEVTLEANPGTAEAERFQHYRQAGVNRLSIGIQSFDDGKLQALGRIHNRQEALTAVKQAQDCGFNSINLDLMFGLPQQTAEQALDDVATATALNPGHISYYQLTLEPNTLFHNTPPPLPDEELLWQIESSGQQALAEAGYRQYEVSAFSREGMECRHNINYWQFGDYIGIGAGAHGKITHPDRRVERRWRLRDPEGYLTKAGTAEGLAGSKLLGSADLITEFMLNALRLHDGVPPELFTQRTGLALEEIEGRLQQAVERGLLHYSAEAIRPSANGRRFVNELVALFLP
jgi:oxygen-independent coproporphyrinogen-3 oxidase